MITRFGEPGDEQRINAALNALGFSADNAPVKAQFEILVGSLFIYAERNKGYKDNWIKMGWRGQLIRIRERSERLWDRLWNWDGDPSHAADVSPDDAYDLINFACFLIRGIDGEATRDGAWW